MEFRQANCALVYKKCVDLPRLQIATRSYGCCAKTQAVNGASSANVFDKGFNGSVTLKLGNWRAMTRKGVVCCDGVGELFVISSLTSRTIVNLHVSRRWLMFLLVLLSSLVLYKLPVDYNPCWKFVSDFEWSTSSGTALFICKLQYEGMQFWIDPCSLRIDKRFRAYLS